MTFILAGNALKLKLSIKETRNDKGGICYALCQNKKSQCVFQVTLS